MQQETMQIGGTGPVRQYYEGVASDTLATIWRRKWLIAACIAVALVGAGLAILLLPKKYTSDVLIKMSFGEEVQARDEQGRAVAQAPRVNLDAQTLIETEARVIRSRAIAYRVMARLNLDEDPAFTPRPSILRTLFDVLAERWPEVFPPAAESPADSLRVLALLRGLAVTNDTRSYLIGIAYTSASPERSATIANAFADEYIEARSGLVAARELAELSATLGPKHPQVVRAQQRLAAADKGENAGAQVAMRAEPIRVPSSPNRIAIVALAVGGAAIGGVSLALALERRDRGFASEHQVRTVTGLPCLGMLPEVAEGASAAQMAAYSETVRTVSAAAGLGSFAKGPQVALITSSLPAEGESLFCVTLARTLVQAGRRVLIIDACPRLPATGGRPHGMTLEEALKDPANHPIFLERGPAHPFTVLRRSSPLSEGYKLFSSAAFEKLLARARTAYDVILIEAPPVVLFSDALLLSRFADLVLPVVEANKTPRKTVLAALQRLMIVGARIDGIVLSRVQEGSSYRDYANTEAVYDTLGAPATVYALRSPSEKASRPEREAAT